MSTTKLPSLVPLESGDRLTRDEFHRRYCERPDIHKAELIQGVVYVASPVRAWHGEPHNDMSGWAFAYRSVNPNVRVMTETTVRLGEDDEVQPDVCLFHEPPRQDGDARVNDNGYIEGAPGVVIEIAVSSAAYDLHDKLESYRRAGVPEYIVWSIFEQQIRWLILREGQYVPLGPDEHGIIESEVFPGLRLNVAAMLSGDRAAVLAELLGRAPRSQS
jgi:Uma2 family endonuclease